MPLFASYLLHLLYGLYFQKFVQLPVNCNVLMPKLEKYRAIYTAPQLCEANSRLWVGLFVYVAIMILVATFVLVFNWKYFIWARPKGDILESQARIVCRFFGVSLLALFILYILYDMRFGSGFFGSVPNLELRDYTWGQIARLHVAGGLIGMAALLGCISRRFRGQYE